ncbi:LOW QUALITY PROTEIN: BLOC-2 complex member HPS3-like [Babylonia areolata]|uniref:LOW QUALITY PROTEIN: BLOC-2 complex member HPS3-like n=1 Tax=Babylonia areolata TaxID=304850 RepID=UPI003FD2A8CB
MVRVFGCHSFKGATVVPVADEPLAVCAEEDLVFVATRQCTILVYKRLDDDGGFIEWRCINTICVVEKMTFNKHKDYVITLEQKKSWKSVSRYIRLYLNWHLELSQRSARQRIKVRIAGKAHSLHSSKEYVPQLEVVELPLDGTVTALDVCHATGNFAVAFGREVKLFHIVEKTVANSVRTYQDVEPFLELCWNFEVISLSLSEEYLACCSDNQVQAVLITYAEIEEGSPRLLARVRSSMSLEHSSSPRGEGPSPRQRRENSVQRLMLNLDIDNELPVGEVRGQRSSLSAASLDRSAAPSTCTQSSFTFGIGAPRPIVDDEHYEQWSFEPDDNIVYEGNETAKTPAKILYLSSLHQGSPHPQRGAAPPVLRDSRGGPVKSSSGVSAKTVLHLSDLTDQDDWLSVILIPSYLQEQGLFPQTPAGWSSSNPVRSPLLPQRCSVCCYVSSRRSGYLYRLHPGVSLVSTYRYTDVAYKVEAGPHLLHVVTKMGLETYTARWGTVALAVSESTEGEEEVRPPSSLDICLSGIDPFFGATDVSHGTDYVALLTKVEAYKGQEDLHWNLYILQNCTVAELYTDMVTFGSRIQETGPSSYLHLLQEAHLLLRWELRRLLNPDPQLHDLFLESCALLGDFYSWPRQDDWHLCLPYYKKSGMSLADVIRQAVQHRQHSKEQTSVYVYGQGLMQYLDWALFHSDMSFTLKEEMSNAVLQIFSQTAPDSLPAVILLSSLEGYSPDLALQLLSDLMTLKESRGEQFSALEQLARVEVQLLLCDPGSAELELSSLDKGELLEICAKHPQLIHREASEFTPLGQLMRCHTPSTLLHLLADIVGQGDMTLDTCLLLLEKNFEGERYKNNQVREFLEVLLSDVKRKLWFEEAAVQLCDIYVQRLLLRVECQPSKQKRSTPPKFHMPAGKGHFAVRFSWLDHMPPVTSPASLSAPCQRVSLVAPGVFGQRAGTASVVTPVSLGGSQSETGVRSVEKAEACCTCAFCLQDLLKLQALLCSKHASAELLSHVLRKIGGAVAAGDGGGGVGGGGARGEDIGRGLCVDAVQSCGTCPRGDGAGRRQVSTHRGPTGGQRVRQGSGQVADAAAILGEQDEEGGGGGGGDVAADAAADDDRTTSSETLQQLPLLCAYRDVLRELVELVPAEEFLSTLPPDGSLWFLLPFVSRCLQRRHLEELKVTVMDKGKALLSQLGASV